MSGHLFSIKTEDHPEADRSVCFSGGCGAIATRKIVIQSGEDTDERITELPYCSTCEKKIIPRLRLSYEAFFESCFKMAKRRDFHV